MENPYAKIYPACIIAAERYNMTDKKKETLRKGRDYNELPERYIFYISRKDIWKDGYTVYEEEKRFRQTGKKHNDGSHLIYVNAGIDDGSRIAKLMKHSGMLESHKKTAWNLEKMGMPLDTIAKVVEEDISVVRQRLKPAK